MSAKDKSLADRIRDNAEEHRSRQAFGPDHPAVRAAKRYCERTGRNWEIGVGGRCELGKRAIKQWAYEATNPIRRAWRYAAGKWAICLGVALLLVVVGLVFIPNATLTILAILAGIALILAAAFAGNVTAKEGLDLKSRDVVDRVCMIVGWTLGVPIALIVFACTKLVHQPWWWNAKRVIKNILAVLVLLLLAALVIAAIVGITLSGAWLDVLIVIGGLAALAGLVALCALIGALVGNFLDRRRQKAVQALRVDPVAQAAALEKLTPVLVETHEAQKGVEEIYFKDGGVPAFEDWVARIGAALVRNGYAWTDLLSREDSWANRVDRFEFLSRQDPPLIEIGYRDLISSIESLSKAQLSPRQRRALHRKQAVSFAAATLFMLKSKVCPNVELPDWDSVNAEPQPELR